MSSTSVSDYRNKCKQLLDDAFKYRSMYFRSLDELEAMMRGHCLAFHQLGLVGRGDSFHSCFSTWVHVTADASVAGGWALAIQNLAGDAGQDPISLFSKLVSEFLDEWLTSE